MEYRKLHIETQQITSEEIWDRRLFNVFVVGLPRSGTSMMTHVLELLGVNMIYTNEDEESREKRNQQHSKRYGSEYQMNEKGFFEIISDNPIKYFHKIMATPYSGCKMVIPITVSSPRMYAIQFNPGVRIIQMWRDVEEIRQSQQASYRADELNEDQGERLRAKYRGLLTNQKLIFKKHNLETLHVDYQSTLKHPEKVVQGIAKFINAPNDINNAVVSIHPTLNRFKKEELEMGI